MLRWIAAFGSWAITMVPAFATDLPDDYESGVFTDDGEPLGGFPTEAVCRRAPRQDAFLPWILEGGTAELLLPPAGTGNTWTIEYRARGRDVDLSWVETSQGSPVAVVGHALVVPSNVWNAAASAPLVLIARATARDAADAEVDLRYADWLILDTSSGVPQFEQWSDHLWPTVMNASGETFTVADLDWDALTAIRGEDGTFFPVEYKGPDPCPPTVAVTFCVDQQVHFEHSTQSFVGRQDYFDNNNDRPALGHWVEAVGPWTCGTRSDYTSWEPGPTLPEGCVTLDLRPFEEYDIWLTSAVRVRGNWAGVKHTQGGGRFRSRVLKSIVPAFANYDPAYYPAYQVVNATTGYPHQGWNASSVLAWGMYRRYVPNFSNTEIFTNEVYPNCPENSCALGQRVYLHPDDHHLAFVIAHEVGHVVGFVTDDMKVARKDYSEEGNWTCVSPPGQDGRHYHSMNSKEWASAAAVEGFANYWAAVVFNYTLLPDCAIGAPTIDFDDNGDYNEGTGESLQPFSCAGMPYGGTSVNPINGYTESASDHLGNWCDGPSANRGNEFDWMRMFWHLDQSMSFSTILEVWDRANTWNWDPNDGPMVTSPWWHIRLGAGQVAPSVQAQFDNAGAIHGTDRL